MRRASPAIGLFVLSPFVGEFVLGNLTLPELGLLPVLAPMYGGGALLIREVARRTGGGWPMIALLAAAYALIEEGPVDQLLWNDSYAGTDTLHGATYLPGLGISVALTQVVLAFHVVWSICVPIAVVEALVPDRRDVAWLGPRGFRVTGAIYLLGSALVFGGTYQEERFLASPMQIGAACVVVAALIASAFAIRGRRLPLVAGSPPPPAAVALFSLATTSLYLGPVVLVGVDWFAWVGVASWCVTGTLAVLLISYWSRQVGWGARHRLALAAGAVLTYVWIAFPLDPERDTSAALDLAGNVVFGATALAVLAAAGRTTWAAAPRSRGS